LSKEKFRYLRARNSIVYMHFAGIYRNLFVRSRELAKKNERRDRLTAVKGPESGRLTLLLQGQVFQEFVQLLDIDRFGKVTVHSRIEALVFIAGHCIGGQGDNRDIANIKEID